MFTGIIESIGEVVQLDQYKEEKQLQFTMPQAWMLKDGESISVNGACLTIESTEPLEKTQKATCFLSQETLQKTNLGNVHWVNLERPLQIGERLSGHWVQGHVDAMTQIQHFEPFEQSWELALSLPEALASYVCEKGSIAIDGVSLTVNQVSPVRCRIIPSTIKQTTFQFLKAGDQVNIEIDILAKYIKQLCQPYMNPSKP